MRSIAPVLPGLVPFGAIVGVAGLESGLTEIQVIGMSLLTYAGASQLAAFQLLDQSAAIPVVVFAALIINLRLVMYSASIATHFQQLSPRKRWGLAYFLVDQVFAISLVEFAENKSTSRLWYYLGVAIPNWAAWQSGVVIGVVLGANIPSSLELDFAIPLLFLAILVPTLEDKETITAALVGGTVAVAGLNLPLQLGLVIGSVVGLLAGLLVDWRSL